MSGAGLVYDFTGLQDLQRRISRLGSINKPELLDIVGATVESQTRRRIQDEKTNPAGAYWPSWSDLYAKNRPGGRTLLMGEDHLLDSITFLQVDQDSLELGSNLIYAATHQYGDEDRSIPARTYLGISADNEEELIRNIDDYLDEVSKR